MRKTRCPKIKLEDALREVEGSYGNVSAIAARLGVNRGTIHRLKKEWPELQEAINEERDALKDHAEGKLAKLIDDENITAIIFYLKTQARERGYVERQEVTGADGGALSIKVEYANFNPYPTETA